MTRAPYSFVRRVALPSRGVLRISILSRRELSLNRFSVVAFSSMIVAVAVAGVTACSGADDSGDTPDLPDAADAARGEDAHGHDAGSRGLDASHPAVDGSMPAQDGGVDASPDP